MKRVLGKIRLALGALFGSGRRELDLTDELRFDLERRKADYRRDGVAPDEAARRARVDLGGVTQVREACRDHNDGSPLLPDFV